MAKLNWKLQNVKIADIKEFSKNPRWLTEKAKKNIKKSLDEFGLIEKLVINSDMVLIGGHQRLHILSEQGETYVECWMPDRKLTEREHSKLCIMLNKAQAEFDFDMLANEWDVDLLNEAGFDLKELGLDDDMKEDSEQNDTALEPPKNPISQLGDLYILGNHRLVCGDSTDAANVAKLLNDNTPILMVTDPPYGVALGHEQKNWKKDKISGKHGRMGIDAKIQNEMKADWIKSYELFPGDIVYIWHAHKFANLIFQDLSSLNFEIISQIIWVKQNFTLSRGDYHWQHEACWYAVRKNEKHNWQGARDQSTTWEISNLNAFGANADDERTAHGTQKPLECMAKPIRNNTAEGEGVYDPFCGSGTTLIACEKLNRKCYAMELDPAYCDIIVKRWMDATGLLPIKNGIELTEFEYAESTSSESA